MSTVKTIESWTDLTRTAEECADGSWIFRGEGVTGYPLLPKAGREGDYRGAARKKPYKLMHEKRALELFKRQARPHLGHTPSSDLEWLVIAQHHGMFTRLLDWTESILVAAYFAAQEAGTRGDAVIYGVRNLRTLTKTEERNPFNLRAPGVYPLRIYKRRNAKAYDIRLTTNDQLLTLHRFLYESVDLAICMARKHEMLLEYLKGEVL